MRNQLPAESDRKCDFGRYFALRCVMRGKTLADSAPLISDRGLLISEWIADFVEPQRNRVVGCLIERTFYKREFGIVVAVLRIARRSRGATIEKKIEKCKFSVAPVQIVA